MLADYNGFSCISLLIYPMRAVLDIVEMEVHVPTRRWWLGLTKTALSLCFHGDSFSKSNIHRVNTHKNTLLDMQKRRHLTLFSFVITKKPTSPTYTLTVGLWQRNLNMSEICWITITVRTLGRRTMYNISLRRGYVTAHLKKSLKNSNSFFKVLKYRLY